MWMWLWRGQAPSTDCCELLESDLIAEEMCFAWLHVHT